MGIDLVEYLIAGTDDIRRHQLGQRPFRECRQTVLPRQNRNSLRRFAVL